MVQQKQQSSTKQLNVEKQTTSTPANNSNDNNEWTNSVMTDLKSLKSKLRKSVRKNKKSTKQSKKDAKDEVHAKLVDIFGSKKGKPASASTAPQEDQPARHEEPESRDDNDQDQAEPTTSFSNVHDSIDISIFDETNDEPTGQGIQLDYDDDEEEQVTTNHDDQWSSKTRSGRLSILPPPSAGTLLETIIDECDEQDEDGDLMIWQDDDDNDDIDASLFDEQQEDGDKAKQPQERVPLQDIQKNHQPQPQYYYSRDQLTSPTATLNRCSESNSNSSPMTPDLSNDALLKDVDMSKLWQQSMLDATATATRANAATAL